MTENSPLYAAADRAQLTAVCRADLALLEHLDRLSESPSLFRAHRLSQVHTFLRVLERGRPNLPYTHVACMVCERYDEAYWRCASEENKHRGMHCAAHAQVFHSVAPSTSTAATRPTTRPTTTCGAPRPRPPGPARGLRAGLGAAGALGRRPLADRHRRRDPRALAAERPVSYL